MSTIRFDSANRARVFEDLARVVDPERAVIALEGDVRDLSNEVVLELADGLLISAVSGHVTGSRAMLHLALATSGSIKLIECEPTEVVDRYPRLVAALAEAEASAMSLEAMLLPCGGLAGVLTADLNALMTQLASLPDAASSVLRLADGSRTVAAILRESPHDELLSARILSRLATTSLLTLAQPEPASEIMASPEKISVRVDDPAALSALPTEDELEGAGVEADVRRWLEHEAAPDALLSEDSFEAAFAQHLPKTPAAPAPALAPLPAAWPAPRPEPRPVPRPDPRPEAAEMDDATLEQAGMSKSPNRAILIGAFVLLAFVVLLMTRGGGETNDPPDLQPVITSTLSEPPVLADTSTTSTATLAETSTKGVSRALMTLRHAPPVAGPDAPEEVRRAETLLNEGKYAEAGKLLDGLRSTRPNDAAVWVLSGQHAVDSGGKLSVANERADRALQIDARFYRGWVLKGSVLQFLGRKKPAADAYNRAVKLEPDHPMSPELRTIVDGLNGS
jgi:hypothetical protein